MRTVLFLAVLGLLVGPATVLGHSGDLGDFSFGQDEMGFDNRTEVQHDDEFSVANGGFKGYAQISVTNTSTSNVWGDFHFEIYGASSVVQSVIFRDALAGDPDNDSGIDLPYSDHNVTSWVYGTTGDGRSTLDAYYYGDPVGPGGTIEFTVYTDNTLEENVWFGIGFWPTPVPEPAAFAMLALGAPLFIRRRRRA